MPFNETFSFHLFLIDGRMQKYCLFVCCFISWLFCFVLFCFVFHPNFSFLLNNHRMSRTDPKEMRLENHPSNQKRKYQSHNFFFFSITKKSITHFWKQNCPNPIVNHSKKDFYFYSYFLIKCSEEEKNCKSIFWVFAELLLF